MRGNCDCDWQATELNEKINGESVQQVRSTRPDWIIAICLAATAAAAQQQRQVCLFINCNLLSQFAFDLSMSHCAMATNGNLLHNQNDAFNSCVYYALQAGRRGCRQGEANRLAWIQPKFALLWSLPLDEHEPVSIELAMLLLGLVLSSYHVRANEFKCVCVCALQFDCG